MRVKAPLTNSDVEKLKIGDRVLLSGLIYTARDIVHQRLVELLNEKKTLPIELKGEIIYYAGPTPARPSKIIGSCGPTTSYRMDPYTICLVAQGLKGMIGKGPRSSEVINALKKYKAVYFVATGGVGALISQCVKKVSVVAYQDLGLEAIHSLEVKDFPVIVAGDCYGKDLFKEGIEKYRKECKERGNEGTREQKSKKQKTQSER